MGRRSAALWYIQGAKQGNASRRDQIQPGANRHCGANLVDCGGGDSITVAIWPDIFPNPIHRQKD